MSAADPIGAGPETWLVTGGAGFIGTNFIRQALAREPVTVVNLDKLTYAAAGDNLGDLLGDPRYRLVRGDICDRAVVRSVLGDVQPDAIVHLAAETHVDRSIDDASEFVRTNVVGTHVLVEAARAYWAQNFAAAGQRFRFLHVSTDEVYGSRPSESGPADETAPYAPSSPYAASKAGADHLVVAAHRTHGFPAVIGHAVNVFGPYQFPEKLIPVVILNALEGKSIPIYGDGGNVRDWLSVHDCCTALRLLLRRGRVGERYNLGAGNQRSNLELARAVCTWVDDRVPGGAPAAERIELVDDRPGHDRRYAVDAGKIRRELGWRSEQGFDDALRATVAWYADHREWCDRIQRSGYRRRRLGLGRPGGARRTRGGR